MRFISICSGIEAASVAFHPLGWRALAFAEIEPFPCRLLAHHYPQVPNLGDLTRWREWSPDLLAQADVLCGGTPCQAFSVAGLRGSLNDERGNLTLTFCHLYDEIDRQRHLHGRPPAVCLWENVPGVLNTPDNAFGHFLAGLAGEDVPLTPPGTRWTDAGYVRGPRRAVAWRTLDAQYFGLAQRRERVFVVASADPAFDPAPVLFELDGLRRDTPPRRGPGEGTAHELAPSLTSSGRGVERPGESRGQDPVIAERMTNAECGMRNVPEVAGTLLVQPVAHSLRGEGFDASQDGTGRGTPLVPIAFSSKDHGADATRDLCPTLRAGNHADSHANGGNAPAIAFPERMSGTQCASESELSPVLQSRNPTAVALREIAPAITGNYGKQVDNSDTALGPMVVAERQESFAFDLRGREGGAMPEGPHATANIRAGSGGSSRSYVAQKAEGGEPLPFDTTQITSATNRSKPCAGDPCHPIASQAHPPAVAFQERGRKDGPNLEYQTDLAYSLNAPNGGGRRQELNVACQEPSALRPPPSASQWRVRRLTPEECEILQGFPVGYTLIPVEAPMQSRTKAKPRKGRRKGEDLSDTIDYLISLGLPRAEAEVLAHAPDGPRYKALGNSWAVPVARWIARRIQKQFAVSGSKFQVGATSNPVTPPGT